MVVWDVQTMYGVVFLGCFLVVWVESKQNSVGFFMASALVKYRTMNVGILAAKSGGT